MRFQVFTTFYGRPVIQRGPMAGCVNFPQYHHELVTPRPVGLARAKAVADAQACRAVVIPANESGVVYSNGKAPAVPDGWHAEPWYEGRR